MVFNSFEFFIFFPVVLLLYFLWPSKLRFIMLLVASYYFYISWNPSLIWLILFTTATSYTASLVIENLRKKYPNREKLALERLCLILALAVSLGVLFFFKYFNFLSDSVNAIINEGKVDESKVSDFLNNCYVQWASVDDIDKVERDEINNYIRPINGKGFKKGSQYYETQKSLKHKLKELKRKVVKTF